MRITVAACLAVACACSAPVGSFDAGSDPTDAGEGDSDAGASDAGACTGTVGTVKTLGTWKDVSHALVYADGKLFASDSARDRVVVFDAFTDAMLGEVASGRVPLYLAAGGGYVFTVNSLATSAPDELSTVISTQSLTRVGGVPIPVIGGEEANFPGDLGFFDGKLYLTTFTFSTPMMFPVDLGTFMAGTGIPAGSGPGPVVGSKGKLFLASLGAIFSDTDDKITVMDTAGTVLASVPTGGKLQRMVVGSDGRVFVVKSAKTAGASRLLAMNPDTHAYSEITVGDLPWGVAVYGPFVYVINTGGPALSGPSITVVDTANGDATRSIDLSTLNPLPKNLRGIAVGPCSKIYLEGDEWVGVYQDQ